jgi:hypothetical protein
MENHLTGAYLRFEGPVVRVDHYQVTQYFRRYWSWTRIARIEAESRRLRVAMHSHVTSERDSSFLALCSHVVVYLKEV